MYPCQMVKDLQLGVGIFQEPGGALHDDAAVVGAKAAGLVRLFNAMEGVNLKAHTGVEAQPFNLLAHWSAVEIDVVVLDDVVDRNNVGETALGQTKPTNSPESEVLPGLSGSHGFIASSHLHSITFGLRGMYSLFYTTGCFS